MPQTSPSPEMWKSLIGKLSLYYSILQSRLLTTSGWGALQKWETVHKKWGLTFSKWWWRWWWQTNNFPENNFSPCSPTQFWRGWDVCRIKYIKGHYLWDFCTLLKGGGVGTTRKMPIKKRLHLQIVRLFGSYFLIANSPLPRNLQPIWLFLQVYTQLGSFYCILQLKKTKTIVLVCLWHFWTCFLKLRIFMTLWR